MSLVVALIPIAWLIWIMTKPSPWPSQVALPIAAVMALAARIFYFQDPANEWGAAVAAGWLLAWTPILIVGGAIFFFKTLEASGAMEILRQWLNATSPSPVARLLIVGWAFQYLIEGASGFGTPAALAAPLLVKLGFPALRVAAFCLILDSAPVAFGAVGTPVWFGFGQLNLSSDSMLSVGVKAAILNGIAGLVIVPVALSLLVDWTTIRQHSLFIVLAVLSCVVPAWLVSQVSSEFPSVIGGAVGLLITTILAKQGIGLPKESTVSIESAVPTDSSSELEAALAAPAAHVMPSMPKLILAMAPMAITVMLLLLTRIQWVGLKDWLQAVDPAFEIPLGAAGVLRLSQSLVFEWREMLGTDFTWKHPLLYVPSLVPFVLIGVGTLWLGRVKFSEQRKVWTETFGRLINPTIALFGALIFVRLLMTGGENASSMIIGQGLAGLTGDSWTWASASLGSLGAFFSGSATVSNLTFGGIQLSISESLGLDTTVILALQTAGASSGNMIAIHNIVAVCSILGLENQEGAILKRTAGPMLLYAVVTTLAALALWP